MAAAGPGPLHVTYAVERYPIDGTFTISRGAKREAVVVVATISDGHHTGRGECTPYARYGETIDSAIATIDAARPEIALSTSAAAMPAGAARNAIDCALWDLNAKRSDRSVASLLLLTAPRPLVTAYTLSLDTPDAMAAKAALAADKPLLKLKLGGPDDVAHLTAVRGARPDARIIVDANEGWSVEAIAPLIQACHAARVELIEQPLPAGQDAALAARPRLVPICADESLHTRADLPRLATLYDAINIKLDKAGGLTEALALRDGARQLGLRIMVGCMVATSLAMAPAVLVAQGADWVDLDGPLLLARDRSPALRYDGAVLQPPTAALWG